MLGSCCEITSTSYSASRVRETQIGWMLNLPGNTRRLLRGHLTNDPSARAKRLSGGGEGFRGE